MTVRQVLHITEPARAEKPRFGFKAAEVDDLDQVGPRVRRDGREPLADHL
jgi:hypothetical protein